MRRSRCASRSPDTVLAHWLWDRVWLQPQVMVSLARGQTPRVCREDIFPPCNSQEGLCSSAFLHCYQIPGSLTCNKKGLFRFIVLQAQGQDYQAVLLCACSGAAHDCGMCVCGEAGPITLYDGLRSLTLTEALPQWPRDFPWCLTSERIYYLLSGFSLTHGRLGDSHYAVWYLEQDYRCSSFLEDTRTFFPFLMVFSGQTDHLPFIDD